MACLQQPFDGCQEQIQKPSKSRVHKRDGPREAGTPGQKEKAIAEFGGVRGKGENRGVYTTPDTPLAWRDLHSDVNGAFNIPRKACPAFEWHSELSMGFKIHWVSPKEGLTAMNLGREKRA